MEGIDKKTLEHLASGEGHSELSTLRMSAPEGRGLLDNLLKRYRKELDPRRAIDGSTPISKVIVLHFANNKPCAGFYDTVKRDWHLFAAYRNEPPTHWEYLPGDEP